MANRIEDAVNKKMSGYNCAQAVACAFKDYVDVSEDELKKITQGFAVGMGTMEGSCGAIVGAAVILGLVNDNPAKTFKDVKGIMSQFKESNGSVICKELKGIETGKVLRECNDCVGDAARMLQEILDKDK
jgi:C_GCAxxG_C_C family probable redox protein